MTVYIIRINSRILIENSNWILLEKKFVRNSKLFNVSYVYVVFIYLCYFYLLIFVYNNHCNYSPPLSLSLYSVANDYLLYFDPFCYFFFNIHKQFLSLNFLRKLCHFKRNYVQIIKSMWPYNIQYLWDINKII